MQGVFIAVYLIGLTLFFTKKRRFDVFTLAYFSCGLYFMPGFVGTVLLPTKDGGALQIGIVNETYLIFIAVCLGILIGALIYDQLPPPALPTPRNTSGKPHCFFLLGLALFGLGMELYLTGNSIFSGEKQEVLDEMTRGYIVFTSAASLLLVCAFAFNEWIFVGIAFILLLFDVYIGFRNSFATSVLAVVLIFFGKLGRFRLIFLQRRYILIILIFGAFVFLYKGIAAAVKLGAWDVAAQSLSQEDYYMASLLGSEPFVTQLILNEAVNEGFHMESPTPLDYLVQIIPLLPELGIDRYLRPMFMSEMLLPGYKFGLGNNIWAEMWIYGDWPMLIGFIVSFSFICGIGSRYLSLCSSKLTLSSLALGFAIWAFYIHRNNLGYQITLEKRVIFAYVLTFAFVQLFSNASKRIESAHSRKKAQKISSPGYQT